MKTVNMDADAEFKGILEDLGVLAAQTERSQAAAGGSAAEVAAGWVAPRYLLGLRGNLASQPEGPERFKLLERAVVVSLALQRGDVWAGRLRLEGERVNLERERLEFCRQVHKDRIKLVMSDEGRVMRGKGKKRDFNEPMSQEESRALVAKVDEVMGLKMN